MRDGRNSDNLNKDNFETFWRPIWEGENEINRDVTWINNIKDTIKNALPPISSEPITVSEDELVTSMKNNGNWSSRGYHQITNYWIEKLSAHFKGIAIALTEIIKSEIPLPTMAYRRQMFDNTHIARNLGQDGGWACALRP